MRTSLQITQPNITGMYSAHELLRKEDSLTSCQPEELHGNESPGKDIHCDEDGLWRNFEEEDGIQVDAGPIVHRGILSLSPTRMPRLIETQFLVLVTYSGRLRYRK